MGDILGEHQDQLSYPTNYGVVIQFSWMYSGALRLHGEAKR